MGWQLSDSGNFGEVWNRLFLMQKYLSRESTKCNVNTVLAICNRSTRYRILKRQVQLVVSLLRLLRGLRTSVNLIVEIFSTIRGEISRSASTGVVNSRYYIQSTLRNWSISYFVYDDRGSRMVYNAEVTGYDAFFIPTTIVDKMITLRIYTSEMKEHRSFSFGIFGKISNILV